MVKVLHGIAKRTFHNRMSCTSAE